MLIYETCKKLKLLLLFTKHIACNNLKANEKKLLLIFFVEGSRGHSTFLVGIQKKDIPSVLYSDHVCQPI